MERIRLDDLTTDQLEAELLRLEILRRRASALMVDLIAEADRRQVPLGDGCRTVAEWVAARLDLPPDEARTLSDLARTLEGLPETSKRLAEGDIGPARAHRVSQLADSDTELDWLSHLSGFDLPGCERLVARYRRVSRRRERQRHGQSYLSIQPTLDQSWFTIRGGLGPVAGQVISQAIQAKADRLPADAGPREHRQALALEQICGGDGAERGDGPSITAFVDVDLAAPTSGEAGAELAYGPRIGPDALEELLCTGRVGIVGLEEGRPVVATPSTRTIPPAIREFVVWRDGACRAPGCNSRHRLQPHHVVPRSHGGGHDPENLITLCWYHHHIVVHRRGFRIEKDTTGRVRFVTPSDSRDPP